MMDQNNQTEPLGSLVFNNTLLTKFRESRGLSLRELGRAVQISHSMICNYETNKRIPTLRNLIKLENFFGLKRGTLLCEAGEPGGMENETVLACGSIDEK